MEVFARSSNLDSIIIVENVIDVSSNHANHNLIMQYLQGMADWVTNYFCSCSSWIQK